MKDLALWGIIGLGIYLLYQYQQQQTQTVEIKTLLPHVSSTGTTTTRFGGERGIRALADAEINATLERFQLLK